MPGGDAGEIGFAAANVAVATAGVAVVGLGLMIGGLVYAEQEAADRLAKWHTWCNTGFTRCGDPASS